jgi:hypothetical protein
MKLRQPRHSRLLFAGFLLASAFAALAPAAHSQSPAPATDAAGKATRLFKVSAAVLDEKNNFVSDLRAEDFIVTENGVPQAIKSFALEDLPASYPLLQVKLADSAMNGRGKLRLHSTLRPL